METVALSISGCECSAPNRTSASYPSRDQEALGRGGKESSKWEHEEECYKHASWAGHGHCPHEVSAAWVLAEDMRKVRPISTSTFSHEGGRGSEDFLPEELYG